MRMLTCSVAPPLRKRSRARYGCSVVSTLTTPTRRYQPFAGTPVYTFFGEGTQETPPCHPELLRRISRTSGRFFLASPRQNDHAGRKTRGFVDIFIMEHPFTRFSGEGTQETPICHPALLRRISRTSGSSSLLRRVRMTTRGITKMAAAPPFPKFLHSFILVAILHFSVG